MTQMPDLDRVFFYLDDEQGEVVDHADDSVCMSLVGPGFTDRESWEEMLNQHLNAFVHLAEYAATVARQEGEAGAWFMGRPLLFAAHHVLELALKSSTFDSQDQWPRGKNGHDLALLLDVERGIRGTRPESRDWENELVARLDRAWEAGRFPVTRSGAPLISNLCCASASGLAEAVIEMTVLIHTSATAAAPVGAGNAVHER